MKNKIYLETIISQYKKQNYNYLFRLIYLILFYSYINSLEFIPTTPSALNEIDNKVRKL